MQIPCGWSLYLTVNVIIIDFGIIICFIWPWTFLTLLSLMLECSHGSRVAYLLQMWWHWQFVLYCSLINSSCWLITFANTYVCWIQHNPFTFWWLDDRFPRSPAVIVKMLLYRAILPHCLFSRVDSHPLLIQITHPGVSDSHPASASPEASQSSCDKSNKFTWQS